MTTETSEFAIRDLAQLVDLWTSAYNETGRPDWSHLLPYYAEEIHFTDSVQEIHGIQPFKEMVERLTRRSGEMRMAVIHSMMQGSVIFMEWEMTILFRNTRTSVVHGASRLTLNAEGKIIEQRDYYDLWGDIFDNIPRWNKLYRKFMRKVFG